MGHVRQSDITANDFDSAFLLYINKRNYINKIKYRKFNV